MRRSPDDANARSTLGSYRLIGEISRDPLGILQLAFRAGTRDNPEWVVVRRLHVGVARDPSTVHAFLGATQAAVRMVHKNIAATLDFGGRMAIPWAAREHLFGVSLLEILTQLAGAAKRVPWPLAAYLIAEAADGVGAVRARIPQHGPPMGFLTGAVPPYVFVTQAGEVKVVDGCLPLLDGAPLMDSNALPYRPASLGSSPPADVESDAFGLGVALWELVAGARLFAGRDDDETHRRVAAAVVPNLRATSRAPGWVDEVVRRAVGQTGPRMPPFADAAEMAEELRAGLVAEGQSPRAADLAKLLKESLRALLAAQEAAVMDAWARELALQEMGEVPPTLLAEDELTRANDQTVSDKTGETAVLKQPTQIDPSDELPTLPIDRVPASPPWRPSSPPSRPSEPRLLSIPRIEYLPQSPPPPPVESPAPPPPPVPRVVRELPSDPRHEPAVIIVQTPPRALRPSPWPGDLPPVAQPLAFVPETKIAPPTVRRPPPPPPAPRPSPVTMVAGAVILLSSAVIAVSLWRRAKGEERPSPLLHASTSSRGGPSASAGWGPIPPPPVWSAAPSWAPLPSASVPVVSPDSLPRVPDKRPAPYERPTSETALLPASTRVGLLTVVCNPACDNVYDGSRSLGPSPVFKVPVTAGVHRLRLRVDATASEKTVTVTVTENETTAVREDVED